MYNAAVGASQLAFAGKLITVQKAAELTGFSRDCLWRRIRQGRLRAYGRPQAYRVSIDDILPQAEPSQAELRRLKNADHKSLP